MAFETEQVTRQLVDQIVDWAAQDAFFIQGSEPTSIRVPFELREPADWFHELDVNNDESQYLELKGMLEQIAGSYRLIHQFGPTDFEELVDRAAESIGQSVSGSRRVRQLADRLYEFNPLGIEREAFLDHVCMIISDQLCGTIHARATSASTRYAPTEAIFQLYQRGYFCSVEIPSRQLNPLA